jgi:hypothetical protein
MKFGVEVKGVKNASGKVVGAEVSSMSYVFEDNEVVTVGLLMGLLTNLSNCFQVLIKAFLSKDAAFQMQRKPASAGETVLFVYSAEDKPKVDAVIQKEILDKIQPKCQ